MSTADQSCGPRRARLEDRRSPAEALAGDWIEVDNARGGSPRRGEILEAIGSGAHLHFRVRWSDERESLFYPAERGAVIHAARSRTGATAR